MTGAARIVRFPPRRSAAVLFARSEPATAGSQLQRAHGWLCGSLHEARAVAHWLADNLGLPVREAS